MPAEDTEVTVTYHEKTYTLTINYVYEDGTKAADTHTEQLKKDAKYDVSSPEITGYVADKSKVSGTMPAEDTEVTVTYTKKRACCESAYLFH